MAQVSSASMNGTNPILHFSYGGFQQARGATLKGNRFYMEGSIEFLDAEGEWHFDASTRELYVFPPQGVRLESATAELVLTQVRSLKLTVAFSQSSYT